VAGVRAAGNGDGRMTLAAAVTILNAASTGKTTAV
jgi:hypothetical protein